MARNLVLDCRSAAPTPNVGEVFCIAGCCWLFLSITADGELWEVLEVATAMLVLLQVRTEMGKREGIDGWSVHYWL